VLVRSYRPVQLDCRLISRPGTDRDGTMRVTFTVRNATAVVIARAHVTVYDVSGRWGANLVTIEGPIVPKGVLSRDMEIKTFAPAAPYTKTVCVAYRVDFIGGSVWNRPYIGAIPP